MNTRLALFLFIALIFGLSACKKNNDAPQTVVLADSLNMVNATADTINIYLNGSRLNNTSNLYPAGSSGYYYVPAGDQTYQIKKVFNPLNNIVQTLFNAPLKLEAHHYYSFFIAGETFDKAFLTVDTLKADTIVNTCYVRFVNASPDAGSLDLALGDTTQFKNQSFKSASGFKLVGVSGLKVIRLFQAGESAAIISGHVALLAGKSYTFYAKGTLTGTGNSVISIGTTLNYN